MKCEACLTEVLEPFVFVVAVSHAVVASHADRLALNGGHVGTGLHHSAPRKTADKQGLSRRVVLSWT